MNSLNIYAAGSLRYALTELVTRFKQHYAVDVTVQFAPAGLLCQQIIQENPSPNAHIFASANRVHPQYILAQGIALTEQVFAHNQLCLTVANNAQWSKRDWLTILLDNTIRIGMSTPKSDPSGDYTFSLFDGIEKQHHGQGKLLKQRALQLVGNELVSTLSNGVLPAEHFIRNDIVDGFIGYASYAHRLKQNPMLLVSVIPQTYYQSIDYSIALLKHPHPYAQTLIDFVLSESGQGILQKNGFRRIDA